MNPASEFRNNSELLTKLRECFISRPVNIVNVFYKNRRDTSYHLNDIEQNKWYQTWSEIVMAATEVMNDSKVQ